MIPWVNLARQQERLAGELNAAAAAVIGEADFILGKRVAALESRFAAYCGVSQGVGVNSGTSALHLALLAAGVGPGDEVITTAFTFMATLAAIGYTGARPVLVDIAPETFTLEVAALEGAITERTRAIVPVHLYGHPADMDAVMAVARRHGLAVIEDAAQAHGAEYKGRKAGSLGDAGCFSFYPSKNLGACGEGGMVVTGSEEFAERVRGLRNWGLRGGAGPLEKGYNYRMEGMQGALLGVKLPYLEGWNEARRRHAALYDSMLAGSPLHAAKVRAWARHVYHIYVIRVPERERVQARLAAEGIETRVHYDCPMHLLAPWGELGYRKGDFPEAERAANEVLSIPVSPELLPDEAERIGQALYRLTKEG